MALYLNESTCQHCGESISLYRFANEVELWVTDLELSETVGRFCPGNVIDEYGTQWFHEPMPFPPAPTESDPDLERLLEEELEIERRVWPDSVGTNMFTGNRLDGS